MKILNGKQARELDRFTIQKNGILSVDLMNKAATKFVDWFVHLFPYPSSNPIIIYCGKGNNGGDGLAIGRLLHEKGYFVRIVILQISSHSSKDFEQQLEWAQHLSFQQELKFPENAIVIDAIFGTGLNRPLEGLAKEAIEYLNLNKAFKKISVDIPSGLFADKHTTSTVFKADITFGFECPKLAYFLPQNFPYVGEWKIESIGLDRDYLNNIESPYFTLEEGKIRSLIKDPSKFDHKGKRGHAFLMVGSLGKIGAAVLATRACLRSGSGLVTVQIPLCGYEILQSTAPEAMCQVDKDYQSLSTVFDVHQFSTIGIGCGIGKSKKTIRVLGKILELVKRPIVLDADGLNILSQNKKWWSKIPEGSVLTPHPKEFERWVGKSENEFERLEKLRGLSKEIKSIIVLKGAHTAIADPSGEIYFNTTGNPGMAKGGSGDILTGILTGLMASGYTTLEAAKIGVWVHGFAGDLAAKEWGEIGMVSGDIIQFIPQAFK